MLGVQAKWQQKQSRSHGNNDLTSSISGKLCERVARTHVFEANLLQTYTQGIMHSHVHAQAHNKTQRGVRTHFKWSRAQPPNNAHIHTQAHIRTHANTHARVHTHTNSQFQMRVACLCFVSVRTREHGQVTARTLKLGRSASWLATRLLALRIVE